MDENPKVIAEIVGPSAVRVGGVLFMRTHEATRDEVATELYSRPRKLLRREHIEVHYMECNECGGTYEHVNGDYERCPHCGAVFEERVVVVDERA